MRELPEVRFRRTLAVRTRSRASRRHRSTDRTDSAFHSSGGCESCSQQA